MLKNYLTIAFRNIWRQKEYAIINIAGLSLGMACCVLIIGFVLTELSYDRYHDNAEQIYRVTSGLTLGDTPNSIATTNGPPAIAMRDEFPEVLEGLRMLPRGRTSVKYKDQEYYEDEIIFADASIMDIFSFPFVSGAAGGALDRAFSVVLTETAAKKYFGRADPLGKTLDFGDTQDYAVTGVVEDVRPNSHFAFDFLLSFETLNERNRERQESWMSPFIYHSYVLLEKGVDVNALEKKFPEFVDRHIGDTFESEGASVEYFLQPVTEIHLYSDLRHEIAEHGDIMYVYAFGLIAIFVLLIACFNFINLATAQSAKRAREIGVRKVLGAEKRNLIFQFLGESLVYSFLSFLGAVLLVRLTLASFRDISGSPLDFDFAATPWLLLGLFLLPFAVGVLAGSYPAFFLASLKPVRVLKSRLHVGPGHGRFRKVLVVSQFTISIALIICVGIVYTQLQYMKNKKLGFETDQIVVVPIKSAIIRGALEEIKQELTRNPNIISVASGSHIPGYRPSGGAYHPEGYLEGQTVMMDGMSMDADYIPLLGIEIVAGRNFSLEHPVDPENSVLINETAAKEIGWENPVGKMISMPGSIEDKMVIGVVKDFHYQYPQKPIRPLYIGNGNAPRSYRAICIKLSSTDITSTIAYLENKWKDFDPDHALDYTFLDESYEKQYRTEQRLSTLFLYFTGFSIFIACLGLFGMSSFSTQQRTREIGVRKVFGASVPAILLLLYKESLGIVLLSFIIAIPIAYYAMNSWLQDFAFRTEIGGGIFLLAGILSLLIAVLSVGSISLRAAMKNPAFTLRHE